MSTMVDSSSFQDYLKNPIHFPPEFKSWLSDYFATNIPKLPISQVFGFKLQSVKESTEITAQENVSSTSYTSFSTDGPTFANVPNGFYLAIFGATYGTTAGSPVYSASPVLYIAPVYNGSTPNDGEACLLNAGSNGRVVLIDLTTGNGQNTLTFKYKLSAAITIGVWNRWAFLLKVVTE